MFAERTAAQHFFGQMRHWAYELRHTVAKAIGLCPMCFGKGGYCSACQHTGEWKHYINF